MEILTANAAASGSDLAVARARGGYNCEGIARGQLGDIRQGMCARPYSASNSQKILGGKKESESSLQVLHAEMHAWLHRPGYLSFPDTTFPARWRDGRNLAYGNPIGYRDSSVDLIVKG